ncbi:uncharacterized protein LOC141628151 [Silene latifolia]|uniref:uncharacterized protein LOC141628151 n=1 Tax=Silene latifolia TaxID=37657 RepID=UPI003D777B99
MIKRKKILCSLGGGRREEGGYQVKALTDWNRAVHLKWLWTLDKNAGAIWTSWVSKYFLTSCTVWELETKAHYPESLRGLLRVRTECIEQMGSIQAVKLLLQHCTVGGCFSITKAYDNIRHKYPVKPVFKAIHRGIMVPRHRIITMLAVEGRLATIDKLTHRGMYLVNRCCLCKQAEESTAHLFFKCPFTSTLLGCIKAWTRMNTGTEQLQDLLLWTHKRARRKHWRNKWISCSLGCLVSEIWHERNLRIFEGRERTHQVLLSNSQFTVSTLLLHVVSEQVYIDVIEALNN